MFQDFHGVLKDLSETGLDFVCALRNLSVMWYDFA